MLLLLLLAGITSCTKEELPRNNPLDLNGTNGNGQNGLPAVADGSIGQIYANGAVFEGEVYQQGCSTLSERGVCYNFSGNPSVAYYSIRAVGGEGKYQCEFTQLIPGYTYYYRAYARNNCGISYGAVFSFTTPFQ